MGSLRFDCSIICLMGLQKESDRGDPHGAARKFGFGDKAVKCFTFEWMDWCDTSDATSVKIPTRG